MFRGLCNTNNDVSSFVTDPQGQQSPPPYNDFWAASCPILTKFGISALLLLKNNIKLHKEPVSSSPTVPMNGETAKRVTVAFRNFARTHLKSCTAAARRKYLKAHESADYLHLTHTYFNYPKMLAYFSMN